MKKLINALLALALVLQLAVPMSAMAEGETTSSYSLDFSTDVNFSRDDASDNMGMQFVKGQFGKGKDDRSMRVYTLGIDAPGNGRYTRAHTFQAVKGDETNKFAHISFEYLLENANAGLSIRLNYKDAQGNANVTTLLNMDQRFYPDIYHTKTDDNHKTNKYTIGTWGKYDVYFEYGTSGIRVFNNGNMFDYADIDFSAIAEIVGFEVVHIQKNAKDVVPSAIQVDNFVFESVPAKADAQDYRYLGEMFTFDDGFLADKTTTSYLMSCIENVNGNTNLRRVSNAGNPSVYFSGTNSNVFFEKGVGGNPAWDTSVHGYNAGGFGYGVTYYPGIVDLQAGDYAHLTFKMLDKSDMYRNSIVSNFFNNGDNVKMHFASGNEYNSHPFFSFADDGNGVKYLKFFKQVSNVKAEQNKWYKIDIVLKVGNGVNTYTKADCYANGELIVPDYEIIPAEGDYSVLQNLGMIAFPLSAGVNVYWDDYGVGVFTADTLHNPTEGYTLTSNDEVLDSCIDNTNRKLILSGDYTIEKFISKINEKDNVTVYDSEGRIVTAGAMEGCSVKVSNGFGGGVWYSLADSMVAVEDNYNKGIPNSKITNVFKMNGNGLYYNNPVTTGGIGGKASDDLAMELDIETTGANGKDSLGNGMMYNSDTWKSNTVVLEGSFLLKNKDSGLSFTMVPNSLNYGAYAQYLMQFNPNGMMRTMYRNVLDEKWQPNRWYKVAAVMNYGSNTLQVYMNGDLVWDSKYVDMDDVAAFADGGSGFTHISQFRMTYNGQVAMDNIRVSYGAYDPSKDKIELSSDDVEVNNEESIIGFEGGVGGQSAEQLVACFEDADMRVYTNGTLIAEAEELDEDSIALVSKGEVFKYYEMGYKTKKLLRPEIAYADNTLTATAELQDTASKVEDSTAVLFLAVYGDNDALETVVSAPTDTVADLTADLTAAISNVDMTGKTAKAFLWDTKTSMIPLYYAKGFELEATEE